MHSTIKETLLHTATHCNTLQHTATHCDTLQHTAQIQVIFAAATRMYGVASAFTTERIHARNRHAPGVNIFVKCCSVLQCVAVCCSVLQCVAVCCSVLQCVAVCCSVLQCAAVCCSVLQCAAVCCSVLSYLQLHESMRELACSRCKYIHT